MIYKQAHLEDQHNKMPRFSFLLGLKQLAMFVVSVRYATGEDEYRIKMNITISYEHSANFTPN